MFPKKTTPPPLSSLINSFSESDLISKLLIILDIDKTYDPNFFVCISFYSGKRPFLQESISWNVNGKQVI